MPGRDTDSSLWKRRTPVMRRRFCRLRDTPSLPGKVKRQPAHARRFDWPLLLSQVLDQWQQAEQTLNGPSSGLAAVCWLSMLAITTGESSDSKFNEGKISEGGQNLAVCQSRVSHALHSLCFPGAWHWTTPGFACTPMTQQQQLPADCCPVELRNC